MLIIIFITLTALVCLGCPKRNSKIKQHSKPWADLKARGFFIF
jgi:hypothetical protein